MTCIFYCFWYNLGEAVKPQQWTRFVEFLNSANTRIFSLFGSSESNGVLACQLVDINDTMIPIGYPLPGVRCLLIDEQGLIINNRDNPSDIGQIHIGG